jgi:hypothetical protein
MPRGEARSKMLHGKRRVPRYREGNRSGDSVKVDRQVPGKDGGHVEAAEGRNYFAGRERHRDYQDQTENVVSLQRGKPAHWSLHELMVEHAGERRFWKQAHYRDQACGKYFDQHLIPSLPRAYVPGSDIPLMYCLHSLHA